MSLNVDAVSVHYGGVVAVSNVSFAVQSGEIVGVIGPNGCGKTSLLNALTGVVACTGRADLDGRTLPLSKPRKIRAAQVLRLFQAPQTMADLTALENVMLATSDRSWTGLGGAILNRFGMLAREKQRIRVAQAALDRVGLGHHGQTLGNSMTYGQRRLLDLARALAAQPLVLMLDEPSAGLTESETEQLRTLLLGLREEGLAVLVIDHKIDFLNGLCDRIVALDQGRMIAEGTPGEVFADARVIEAYLGVTHA